MRIDSLHLLLAFLLALTVITAWVMRMRAVAAEQAQRHAGRLLDIRTAQRDEARAERDAAVAHAEECQELLSYAAIDIRTHQPSLSLIEGGEGA